MAKFQEEKLDLIEDYIKSISEMQKGMVLQYDRTNYDEDDDYTEDDQDDNGDNQQQQ